MQNKLNSPPLPDLISRTDAISAISGESPQELHYASWYIAKLNSLPKANIPIIQITPTSYWETRLVRGDQVPVCHSCGCDSGTLYEFDYCPNCGCKMTRGGRDD